MKILPMSYPPIFTPELLFCKQTEDIFKAHIHKFQNYEPVV